jgi:hypothetical protein
VPIRFGPVGSACARLGEDLRPEFSATVLGFALRSGEHASSFLAAKRSHDQREDALAEEIPEELASEGADELDHSDRTRDCELQDMVKRHQLLRRAR